MNSAVQIFRRLLTFRSYNRIISLSYCDDRKEIGRKNLQGKESVSPDSSVDGEQHSQIKINNNLGTNENSISGTHEAQAAVTDIVQPSRDQKLLKTSTHDYVKKADKGILRENSPGPGKGNVRDISKTDAREEMGTQSHEKERDVAKDTSTIHETGDGFLAAYKKQDQILSKSKQPSGSQQTFASLLRNSPFVDMGDPVGKVVIGEVFLVVENDLYIDFGWKFHAVCPKPKQSQHYGPGAKVYLKINELELAAKFLGEKNYISLLEADCQLLGLYKEKNFKTGMQEKEVE